MRRKFCLQPATRIYDIDKYVPCEFFMAHVLSIL